MSKHRKPGDYTVGYGRPPEHARFKPGEGGNPAGRPRRARKPADVAGVLNSPIEVKRGGKAKTMAVFEVGLRRLAERAVKGKSLPAAREFLAACEKYGVVTPAPAARGTGCVHVPNSWDWKEWMAMHKQHGRPPWPGERSGLCNCDSYVRIRGYEAKQ